MKATLNSLQEFVLVQQNKPLSDQEGGVRDEWQDIGRLWVKREILPPMRRHMGRATRGYRFGAKYLEDPIYIFSARRHILIKAGMRLKGVRTSYTVFEDGEDDLRGGWQQFCGMALKDHEKEKK